MGDVRGEEGQPAGGPGVAAVYAVLDDFTVAPTGAGTVTLTTADPHDIEPAPVALVGGHAAFTIDPRTATNLGWQIQPSGAPGTNVASDPYIVSPAIVDQTVVVLPGETLEAGLGFQGTADHQVIDSPFNVDAIAIDAFFNTVPGAVGRTSTCALCNVTLPWVLQIANRGSEQAAADLPPIASAINIHHGEVTNRAVAETFGMAYNNRFDP